MAKDKNFEYKYKIEGLRRMIKRKIKRGRIQRIKGIQNQKRDDDNHYLFNNPDYWDN